MSMMMSMRYSRHRLRDDGGGVARDYWTTATRKKSRLRRLRRLAAAFSRVRQGRRLRA